MKRKLNRSSSNSKDINEKLTPSTPGTPTNASNSLSISDGKEDFLIDDEIADQPALMFEDTTVSMPPENSSETIVESTPKPKRKAPMGFDGSPLSSRRGKFSQSNRTGSLDTLSPCESIASDDLMMDFNISQSSGLDDWDGQSSGYPSMNETLIQKTETEDRGLRDWNSLLGNRSSAQDKQRKSTPSRSRLLSGRATTPNTSSYVDSPRSLEGRATRVGGRPSAASSPMRHSRVSNLSGAGGYDSDDSIRLDRTNRKAIKQDIVSIKTMLLKLRRVLNEAVEEELMRSETLNPFESQHLTNGIFNGLPSPGAESGSLACGSGDVVDDEGAQTRFEVAELRRQVLYLQGQLEDREKTVQSLRSQMDKLAEDECRANSAPASSCCDAHTTNAATQTERCE